MNTYVVIIKTQLLLLRYQSKFIPNIHILDHERERNGDMINTHKK